MSSNASAGGGGVSDGEPQLKKRRTGDCDEDEFQHDGPVEDEETAREKMEAAGFDPDDVKKECRLSKHGRKAFVEHGRKAFVSSIRQNLHPMSYFCHIGDVKMCRYLLSKGGSTTAISGDNLWFPMYSAAMAGHLDICEWLYENGARGDIKRRNAINFSPLCCAVGMWCKDRKNTSRWLILKGALAQDASETVSPELIGRDLIPTRIRGFNYDERPQLLEWARESVQTHSSFMTFLMGTLSAPTFTRAALHGLLVSRLYSNDAAEMLMKNTPEEQYELLWSKIIACRTPIRCLGGKIGVLRRIADYAGIVRGRELRILRTLIGPLEKLVPQGFSS